MTESEQTRLEGNQLVKEAKFEEAIEVYSRGIVKFGELEEIILKSKLLLNRSICFYNLNRFDECIADCTEAIELDPEYTKAFLRRAMAHEKVEHFLESQNDFERVFQLDPSLRPVYLVQYDLIKSAASEQTDKQKEEVMGQLKTLGNSFLGLFGMSTDDFQLNQGEGGGYSVSMKK